VNEGCVEVALLIPVATVVSFVDGRVPADQDETTLIEDIAVVDRLGAVPVLIVNTPFANDTEGGVVPAFSDALARGLQVVVVKLGNVPAFQAEMLEVDLELTVNAGNVPALKVPCAFTKVLSPVKLAGV
jgi:hypothetical protein